MKHQEITRGNFSLSGKISDMKLYPKDLFQPGEKHVDLVRVSPRRNPPSHTSGFTSVSREVSPDYRFPEQACRGELTHNPEFEYGKSRRPSWSFAKAQKYNQEPFQEFQLCHKHPFVKECSHGESAKNSLLTTVRSRKSAHNYSIIEPRRTSSVGFFSSSKITRPTVASKEDLNKLESELAGQRYQKQMSSSAVGDHYFSKHTPRPNNRIHKSFELVQVLYSDQRQFNNFADNPKIFPDGHIDIQKHTKRPNINLAAERRVGPSLAGTLKSNIGYSIDFTRIQRKAHIKFDLFASSYQNRLDRAEAEPTTRLDYQPQKPPLPGLLEMQRQNSRPKDLFPIVDPAIKKSGDREMKRELYTHTFALQINSARSPN